VISAKKTLGNPNRLIAAATYPSGRSPDWIKVKNPDAPAVTRVEGGW
jgi:hypothetical protein